MLKKYTLCSENIHSCKLLTMNKINFALISLVSSSLLFSQQFPEIFTDEMQEQFLSLSPSQKESLAIQYGIDIDAIENSSTVNNRSNLDDRYKNDLLSQQDYDQIGYSQENMTVRDINPSGNRLYQNNNFIQKPTNFKKNICFDKNGKLVSNTINQISSTNSIEMSKDRKEAQIQCFDAQGKPLDSIDINAENEEKELERYGISLFKDKVISTFSPYEDIPVGDSYILGAGDQLSIKLVGAENSLLNATIERNGAIFIPKIGEITLVGLTFKDAVKSIESRIQQELIGVTPIITMGRLKSINIFMAGEVNSPGMYTISSLSTVTQSLYQAGGLTEIGSLRNIKVLRNGVEVTTFDAYDLLIYGNKNNDIRLRSGDVVLVPPYEGLVEAKGELKRTYKYEIKPDDTIGDLLIWSGGYTKNAFPSDAILERSTIVGDIPNVTNLNLRLKSNLDKKLLVNDSILIPTSSATTGNYVSVLGAINRTGKRGWYEGMKVSDILSNSEDYFVNFSDETDLEIALIERIDQKTKQYTILAFSPYEIINNISSKSNFALEDLDVIYFLPNSLIDRFLLLDPLNKRLRSANVNGQELKLFSIDGDVKFPGSYPIAENMNLSNSIKLAGGANDSAYLNSIEVSRQLLVNSSLQSEVFEIDASNNSDQAGNFNIQPRDRVNIRKNNELVLERSFQVKGFVNFPGKYPLNQNETLSSVIRRAGGLKNNAFPAAAVLNRLSILETQKNQNIELASSIRTSYASSMLTAESRNTTFEDIESISRIIEELDGDGRIVIDLEEAITGNVKYDIAIEDGDTLYIPQFTNIVNIIGEVLSPNIVNYSKALNVSDYVNLAGGFTKRADTDNIYIIRANGSITLLKKSIFSFGLSTPKFYPGDTLVVPIKQNYQSPLPLWSEVTQIIYQSMVSLAAVKGL